MEITRLRADLAAERERRDIAVVGFRPCSGEITMNDYEYYNACAIAALRELIAKVPLADKDKGHDADGIGYEICKSADRYAADMVRIRRERIGPMLPESKESNPTDHGARSAPVHPVVGQTLPEEK